MTINNTITMNQNDLINRANEERDSIFARYDLGRKNGAKIDYWEESQFTVYQNTDKYGFIHNESDQTKKLHSGSTADDRILLRIQQEREKKWQKMVAKWDKHLDEAKLRKRIYKGIPDTYRTSVWQKLLKIEQIIANNVGIYESCLKLARKCATEAKQIDSDVNRQFRDHIIYHERYSIKQVSLFKVLIAYSMYNMEVGYCQGMAGLAGVLLMYMDEEQAFWSLNDLLTNEKYGMHGFFMIGFPKLIRYTKHHDTIVKQFLPKLKKHLDVNGVDSILYSLKWFFVIFVERIPFDLCLRIWDVFLYEGEKVLLGMSYTILKIHKNKLLKLKEMDTITTYLQSTLYYDFGHENDYVIKVLEQSIDELKRHKLNLPPTSPNNELSGIKNRLGIFMEQNTETKSGLRNSIFTESEKIATEKVIERQESTQTEVQIDETNSIDEIGDDNSSHTTGFTSGDLSSYIGCSSLTETSNTSTIGDISVFSGNIANSNSVDCNSNSGQISIGNYNLLRTTPTNECQLNYTTNISVPMDASDAFRLFIGAIETEVLNDGG